MCQLGHAKGAIPHTGMNNRKDLSCNGIPTSKHMARKIPQIEMWVKLAGIEKLQANRDREGQWSEGNVAIWGWISTLEGKEHGRDYRWKNDGCRIVMKIHDRFIIVGEAAVAIAIKRNELPEQQNAYSFRAKHLYDIRANTNIFVSNAYYMMWYERRC